MGSCSHQRSVSQWQLLKMLLLFSSGNSFPSSFRHVCARLKTFRTSYSKTWLWTSNDDMVMFMFKSTLSKKEFWNLCGICKGLHIFSSVSINAIWLNINGFSFQLGKNHLLFSLGPGCARHGCYRSRWSPGSFVLYEAVASWEYLDCSLCSFFS